MKRRLMAALFLPGAAALVLVWGCPSVTPPTTECAAVSEACTTTDDCCDGLACDGGVCVASSACAAEGDACTDTNGCCDGLTCTDGVCATPPPANVPALPSKTIELDLMAIHDQNADGFNGNCIGCHGDRTNEVALDGHTPAAHAVMLSFFGTGNDRCIACHEHGPNFYDYRAGFGALSRGALGEQVDMAGVGCASCHGANATPSFYAN